MSNSTPPRLLGPGQKLSLCRSVPKCTLGAPSLEEENHACAEAQDHA